jgi:hypothetical protein
LGHTGLQRRAKFWTAASRQEQAEFSQPRGLFAGRTNTNKQAIQQAESVQAVQTKPYMARFCWAVQPTAGRYFLLWNVNLSAGNL